MTIACLYASSFVATFCKYYSGTHLTVIAVVRDLVLCQHNEQGVPSAGLTRKAIGVEHSYETFSIIVSVQHWRHLSDCNTKLGIFRTVHQNDYYQPMHIEEEKPAEKSIANL